MRWSHWSGADRGVVGHKTTMAINRWTAGIHGQPQRPHPLRIGVASILSGWLFCLSSTAAVAQACTREYMPVCGQVVDQPQPQTFANGCLLRAAQATWLASGACPVLAEPSLDPSLAPSPESVPTPPPLLWPQAPAPVATSDALLSHDRRDEALRSQIVTWEVAPQRQACVGLIERQCLQIRSWPTASDGTVGELRWTLLYNEIAGFTHQPGAPSCVRVRADAVARPPADGSSVRYTLLAQWPCNSPP